MICPRCGAKTRVIYHRLAAEGRVGCRRRQCINQKCRTRFSSYEKLAHGKAGHSIEESLDKYGATAQDGG